MAKYSKEVNRILRSIQHGDVDRVKDLFDLTFVHFSEVARLRLWNRSYVDDAVMETYENALKYIESFDPKKDGYNWLYKTLLHIIFNYNKREKNRGENERILTDIDTECEYPDEFFERLSISDAISDLDSECKKIIYFYYYAGYTLSEIGDRLRVSAVAVHKKIKRIEKILRSRLTDV